MEALLCGTLADKRRAMVDAGIIDADGNPTDRYRDWGDKISRGPDVE